MNKYLPIGQAVKKMLHQTTAIRPELKRKWYRSPRDVIQRLAHNSASGIPDDRAAGSVLTTTLLAPLLSNQTEGDGILPYQTHWEHVASTPIVVDPGRYAIFVFVNTTANGTSQSYKVVINGNHDINEMLLASRPTAGGVFSHFLVDVVRMPSSPDDPTKGYIWIEALSQNVPNVDATVYAVRVNNLSPSGDLVLDQ
jgi:hypothetical protein